MKELLVNLLLVLAGFCIGTLRRRFLISRALKEIDPNEPQPIFDAKMKILHIFNEPIF